MEKETLIEVDISPLLVNKKMVIDLPEDFAVVKASLRNTIDDSVRVVREGQVVPRPRVERLVMSGTCSSDELVKTRLVRVEPGDDTSEMFWRDSVDVGNKTIHVFECFESEVQE